MMKQAAQLTAKQQRQPMMKQAPLDQLKTLAAAAAAPPHWPPQQQPSQQQHHHHTVLYKRR
jgi:hypothetical protein